MSYKQDIPNDKCYYTEAQRYHEEQAEVFCQRVNESMHDIDTFKMFLHDIDPDAAEVQAFHGCLDDKDYMLKAFAYDQFMNMYEEYVTSITEL